MADRTSVSFQMVTPAGPPCAYHVGCIINNSLYVHGGIDKAGSTNPLRNFHRFNFNTGTWSDIRSPNSPALSHHACVVIGNQYIVLVGGWTGKARVSDVVVYDTVKEVWSYPRTTGFPEGAGLSSHSANLLGNGDILVVGRQGSLRMQRRIGSAFFLRGDIDKGSFKYCEHVISVTSRTGHSLHLIGSKVVIIGGRDDKVVEIQMLEKGLSLESCSTLARLNSLIPYMTPVAKGMNSRRHHMAISCSHGIIFVHGGWTFDGKNRDPVSDMYLLTLKDGIHWYFLGNSGVGLAGHICCSSSDRVFVHGGETGRGVIASSLYELKLSE